MRKNRLYVKSLPSVQSKFGDACPMYVTLNEPSGLILVWPMI